MCLQQGLSGKIPGGILCQKRKLFIAGGHTLYAVLHTMPFCSQIQEEGHLIGNHTYNHVQLDKISKEAAKEEIETTNQKIFEITGVYPAWLRPPYGEWRKNLDFYVEMFPVLWDVDTLDWKSKNVDSIMKIVRSEVSDGAVILMHDAYQSSVDAALQIVDLLMAEEYEFVTVEELILP